MVPTSRTARHGLGHAGLLAVAAVAIVAGAVLVRIGRRRAGTAAALALFAALGTVTSATTARATTDCLPTTSTAAVAAASSTTESPSTTPSPSMTPSSAAPEVATTAPTSSTSSTSTTSTTSSTSTTSTTSTTSSTTTTEPLGTITYNGSFWGADGGSMYFQVWPLDPDLATVTVTTSDPGTVVTSLSFIGLLRIDLSMSAFPPPQSVTVSVAIPGYQTVTVNVPD